MTKWTKIRDFLAGKKTYIAAGVLFLVAAVLAWIGSTVEATAVFSLGLGLCGLRAHQERTAQQLVASVGALHEAVNKRDPKIVLTGVEQNLGDLVREILSGQAKTQAPGEVVNTQTLGADSTAQAAGTAPDFSASPYDLSAVRNVRENAK